ncbi:MAG: CBS domain-containing protein [Firmicutes bacterium]|nr:CBS domain-containing protein [Bacillota bacterium]
MKALRQLLDEKGHSVVTVQPTETVYAALERMAQHRIGALLVMEGKRPVGIFSERDYARKVVLNGKSSRTTPVREVMSEKVLYVTPDQTVEECMAIMTSHHFRHLPVLESDGSVAGFLSIGDLVKETISAQQFIIEQMEKYISS